MHRQRLCRIENDAEKSIASNKIFYSFFASILFKLPHKWHCLSSRAFNHFELYLLIYRRLHTSVVALNNDQKKQLLLLPIL